MDAFYASVEELDHPQLKGKPVAVGGAEKRGVVAAANYVARTFGVRSAMSGAMARRKCPDLIFVPPRFARYKEISSKIHDIFHDYTDLVEPLSLDEAYLDVTENKKGNPSATLIAREIRNRIKGELGLNASAGISCNKFVAKIASDINKPNGQKTIPPEAVPDFMEHLDIPKFYGIGKVTAQRMYGLGIFTGKDLKGKSLDFLESHFGKSGTFYYNVVRGLHESPVRSHRTPKSVGAERTFGENLSSEVFMLERLEHIAAELETRLKKSGLAGKTITLKIKYSDFTIQTRSRSQEAYIADRAKILETAKELLYQEKPYDSVRLLGLSLSNLNTGKAQEGPKTAESVSVQLRFEF